MGGVGSGRTGGLRRTWGYRRLTLKGVTRRRGVCGRRERLGPRYPDRWLETSAGTFAIEWTECHFGGHRVWFTCSGCQRRVATLYAPRASLREGGPGDWRCRHCHRIEYETQYQSEALNAVSRVQRAGAKIGATTALTSAEELTRPTGMKRKKFARLLGEYELAQTEMFRALGAWLDRRQRHVEELQGRIDA